MAICSLMLAALGIVEFRMAAVDFVLCGSDQCIEQVVGLDAESLAAGNLDVRLSPIFLAHLVAKVHGAARGERDHLVGKVGVMRGLVGIPNSRIASITVFCGSLWRESITL